jgi:pyoverdine/dityrosine biosynthesis protein Dit1
VAAVTGLLPHLAPARSLDEEARAVLAVLLRGRRLLPSEAGDDGAHEGESAVHFPKLLPLLAARRPLELILPAFPAKSANRRKTLGDLPDLGEQLGLARLQSLCDEIRALYAPGASVTICSDGRVFSDLVGVSDEAVTRYREELKALIGRLGAHDLRVFDLDDVFDAPDYASMREELLVGHAETIGALKRRVRESVPARELFNGIHRFVFEDTLEATAGGATRSQVRERSKHVAYRVIQRSNAWSNLIARRFPEALRLSIHPQPRVSEKIGIALVRCASPWGTPWHTVVLAERDGYRLVKRAEAEQQNAVLVYRDGRPSHFALHDALVREMVA